MLLRRNWLSEMSPLRGPGNFGDHRPLVVYALFGPGDDLQHPAVGILQVEQQLRNGLVDPPQMSHDVPRRRLCFIGHRGVRLRRPFKEALEDRRLNGLSRTCPRERRRCGASATLGVGLTKGIAAFH